jgi:soluble lytic murein transglycosylase-like protein
MRKHVIHQAKAWFGSALLSVLLMGSGAAQAGNQKEEQLADSVRLALAHAIQDGRPPKPTFRDAGAQARYQQWFDAMSARLKRRLPDDQTRTEFLESAWYEATRAGLDPGLVLGLIQVESAYRKYAVSMAGARGYMQVMPFWTRIIGDSNKRALFDMQANLRYGCSILRMYIDMEGGNLYLALGRYNGSRGRPEYPNAVLAAWKNWMFKPDAGTVTQVASR